MADPVKIIAQIFDAALVIANKVNDVRSFPAEAEKLSSRVSNIANGVKLLNDHDTRVKDNATYCNALNDLVQCLRNIITFLDKFIDPDSLQLIRLFIKSSHYVHKFSEYNDRLDTLRDDLGFVMEAVKISLEMQKTFFAKTRRIEDISDIISDIQPMIEMVEEAEKKLTLLKSDSDQVALKATLAELRSTTNEILQYTIYKLIYPWLSGSNKDRDEAGISQDIDGNTTIKLPSIKNLEKSLDVKGSTLEDDSAGGDSKIEESEAAKLQKVHTDFQKLKLEAINKGDQDLATMLKDVFGI